MLFLQGWAAKLLALVVVLATTWATGYFHGKKIAEADHADQERAATEVLADLSVRNADLDRRLLAGNQQAAETRTITVVKWRDKAVALPERNCGWTEPERVLLGDGYCAAYAGAPECVQPAVPEAAVPAR